MITVEFTYKDGSKETFDNVSDFINEDDKIVFLSDGNNYSIHINDIKYYTKKIIGL